ncbi:hypothetical protein [Megamonas funiformis]|jgi:hypothetical protein
MISSVKIIYIDDNMDSILSRFLNKIYKKRLYTLDDGRIIKKDYDEILFDNKNGYEVLFKDQAISSANIILIDNHLFEEYSATTGKFSGKQFKIILRKLFPFIEVIIITQDPNLKGDNIIKKFSGKDTNDANKYYEDNLIPVLDMAIKRIVEFEELADDLRKSDNVDKALKDKVLESIEGNNLYDELTKSDIDELIRSFKELKDEYSR